MYPKTKSTKRSNQTNPGKQQPPEAEGKEHRPNTDEVYKRQKTSRPTFIAIDLETTDLIRAEVMPHITQVAAMEISNGELFAKYVQPKRPIAPEAQRLTGISTDRNGDLTLNGTIVNAIPIKRAIKRLCTWLQKFENVILIAHNGRNFDFRILMHAVRKNQLTEMFIGSVCGMVDSLPVLKEMFPNERSYKLNNLVERHLNQTFDAHNAEADVKVLGALLKSCDESVLLRHRFSPADVM